MSFFSAILDNNNSIYSLARQDLGVSEHNVGANGMTAEQIIEETVKTVREFIAQEENLSPALKGSLEVMILLVSILVNRLGLNSRNSSKPPVADPYRKKAVKTAGGRKAGGQPGHPGKTLKQVADQLQLLISAGSIVNFNQDAYRRLEVFDLWVKGRLTAATLLNLDETGVNINGICGWLHNTSTLSYSYFYPHQKRGGVTLDEIVYLGAEYLLYIMQLERPRVILLGDVRLIE